MPNEINTVVIASLIGVLAFMARHYFLRIERHLVRSHELFSFLTEHEIRLDRLEMSTYGRTYGRAALLQKRSEESEARKREDD